MSIHEATRLGLISQDQKSLSFLSKGAHKRLCFSTSMSVNHDCCSRHESICRVQHHAKVVRDKYKEKYAFGFFEDSFANLRI